MRQRSSSEKQPNCNPKAKLAQTAQDGQWRKLEMSFGHLTHFKWTAGKESEMIANQTSKAGSFATKIQLETRNR